MLKKILSYISSILFIFLLWLFFAHKIDGGLILPYPSKVFLSIGKLVHMSQFWTGLLYTFIRVVLSFCISLVLGFFIGWIRSASEFFKGFFEIPLAIIKSTPVIAVILMAMFWFKSYYLPVFVAVLMALPVISTSVFQGFQYENNKLIFMAECFNFTGFQKFRYIKLPQLLPHFYSGCISTFGLCWKVVVAGEVLSLPKNGFGTMLSRSQIHLETADVMAITIILITVSFTLERLLKVALKNEK